MSCLRVATTFPQRKPAAAATNPNTATHHFRNCPRSIRLKLWKRSQLSGSQGHPQKRCSKHVLKRLCAGRRRAAHTRRLGCVAPPQPLHVTQRAARPGRNLVWCAQSRSRTTHAHIRRFRQPPFAPTAHQNAPACPPASTPERRRASGPCLCRPATTRTHACCVCPPHNRSHTPSHTQYLDPREDLLDYLL